MGRFSDETTRRIRDANDIAQVVESYNIRLRRVGSNLVALCPFHNEKTPSFNINSAHQFFKCFGCDAKGDVITFVQMMEHVDFPEALTLLANRAGIPVEREESRAPGHEDRDTETRKAIRWANAAAVSYFEEMLRDPREGRLARDYLLNRGFTQETLATWRIGWAPERWDALLERLVSLAGEHKRDKAIEAGLAAGLLRRKEDGKTYDLFRGRVMFPILDMQHQAAGFGGRVFEEKPEAGGKYINTPEGRLFEKRKILFGLGFAAKEIGVTHTVIVVEGYTDTIMCHQHGLRNVVATLGTSLTREHIQRLRRFVRPEGRVIAIFDSDAAGEKATERAIRLFMEEDVPLQVVRVGALKDACEFLPKFGAEGFRAELAKAEDSFRYRLRQLTPSMAGGDVSRRATAVEEIMGLVNCCPNRVQRAMMRKEVAAAAGIPEEALPQPPAEPGAPPAASGAPRGLGSAEVVPLVMKAQEEWRQKTEKRFLQYALQSAEWAQLIFAEVRPETFSEDNRPLATWMHERWEAGARPELASLDRAALTPGTVALAADLAVDVAMDFSAAELRELLRRVKIRSLEQARRALLAALQEARDQGDPETENQLFSRKMQLDRDIETLKMGGLPPT